MEVNIHVISTIKGSYSESPLGHRFQDRETLTIALRNGHDLAMSIAVFGSPLTVRTSLRDLLH